MKYNDVIDNFGLGGLVARHSLLMLLVKLKVLSNKTRVEISPEIVSGSIRPTMLKLMRSFEKDVFGDGR